MRCCMQAETQAVKAQRLSSPRAGLATACVPALAGSGDGAHGNDVPDRFRNHLSATATRPNEEANQ